MPNYTTTYHLHEQQLKVFSLWAAISLAIKYAGPSLSIPSTDFNALIAVFSPSPIVAAILVGAIAGIGAWYFDLNRDPLLRFDRQNQKMKQS